MEEATVTTPINVKLTGNIVWDLDQREAGVRFLIITTGSRLSVGSMFAIRGIHRRRSSRASCPP
jgi:hypothetical protein